MTKNLVIHARRGEAAALEVLVTRALPKVRGLARKLTGEAEEGDALAQEAMVAALETLEKYRGQASFSTWVCAIALRRHTEGQRREARARRQAKRPKDKIVNPTERVEERDTTRRLLALVAELPTALAEAIIAHATSDTPAEAAAALGLGPGAFRVRLHRARLALRELLQKEYPEWSGEVKHARG